MLLQYKLRFMKIFLIISILAISTITLAQKSYMITSMQVKDPNEPVRFERIAEGEAYLFLEEKSVTIVSSDGKSYVFSIISKGKNVGNKYIEFQAVDSKGTSCSVQMNPNSCTIFYYYHIYIRFFF